MMAATLSRSSSLRAFSANTGFSLAPSSTTASILLPSTPPAALISSMARFSASTSAASAVARGRGQLGHTACGAQHDHRAAGLDDLAAVEGVRHVKFLCSVWALVIGNI